MNEILLPSRHLCASPAGAPAFVGNLILTDDGVVFFASTRAELDLVTCTTDFSSSLTATGATAGLGAFDVDPSTAGMQGLLTVSRDLLKSAQKAI